MEVLDTVRAIEHSLQTGIGKSLLAFRLHPGVLHPLAEDSVRYWDPQDLQWM